MLWYGLGDKKTLNACSVLFNTILVKPTWIEKILEQNSLWITAFFHTLGHELGHKSNEPLISFIPTKRGKFKNWVRECRCDFYGKQFLQTKFLINRNDIYNSINTKIDINAPDATLKEKSYFSHPSWSLRWKLLNEYEVFGKGAIQYIANELNFKNQKYIQKVIEKAKLNVITKEEKNEVCDNIYKFIDTKLNTLIDDRIFSLVSLQEIEEYYYEIILNNVENASVKLINVVIRTMYPNINFENEKDYNLKICEFIGLKKLPKDILSDVNELYNDIFENKFPALVQKYEAKINELDLKLEEIEKTEESIAENSVKPNITEGLTTRETQLFECYDKRKELFTLKEMFEFELEYIKTKFYEFGNLDDEISVSTIKKKKTLQLCKETAYDAKFIFDSYKEYIEIADDNLNRPYAIFYKIKYYSFVENARKELYLQIHNDKEKAVKEYSDKLNALTPIDDLHNFKNTNHILYNTVLKKFIDDNEIIKELVETIDTSVSLRNRKNILLATIELFNQSKYNLFNNILPIQIEGLFGDYLYDTTTFERFSKTNLHFDAVLKQKISLLQEANSDIYPEAVIYFRFHFNNLIRNKIAHGRYTVNDSDIQSEILAQELLLDLNMLVYMLSRNSETEKMYRHIRNYQNYYNRLSDDKNVYFEALFNDLIGQKTVLSYDKVENYTPMQVAYWLINPHYEEIYVRVTQDNQLIKLRDSFLSVDFWNYVIDRLEQVINSNFDFLNIHSQTISVVKALFRCNISEDTKNALKKVMAQLTAIKGLNKHK